MERTKPVEGTTPIVRSHKSDSVTIRIGCECGVQLTYNTDSETIRQEKTWTCFKCSKKHLLRT